MLFAFLAHLINAFCLVHGIACPALENWMNAEVVVEPPLRFSIQRVFVERLLVFMMLVGVFLGWFF